MMMEKKQCKVKVAIRVRPPLNDNDKTCVSVADSSVQIFNHRNVNENIQYDFSAVYGMECSQQKIYKDCVKPLIPQALQGQNISIFAYGPTGAGKTHTMLGTSSNPGVIPRVINELFHQIELDKEETKNEWVYKITFSYLEIYQEKVQDLLEPSNTDLPIREDADKNILIPGLAKKEIHNFDEFKMAFGPASNNRTVAATKLNNRSSRSHSILQLMVTKAKPCKVLHGKIYLIDLAGSEDNRRTGNQGIRLKESGAINKSLFSLGEVVDAINSGSPRIPYRNSKLTRLLQDSIGGTCHSVMITNIAPEERYYYDTYCTLNFATKSKKIVNNTCTRETIVKPTPPIRKTPPCPSLPEEENKVKRQKLTEPTQPEASTPPQMSDPAPYLSPLIRRQAKLEEAVNKRLEILESNLLQQIKSVNTNVNHNQDGLMTPKSKAIDQIQKQLEASHAQLKELASRHMVPAQAPVSDNSNTSQEEKKVLQDKTNVPTEKGNVPLEKRNVPEEKRNVPPEKRVPDKGRPLCGSKRKKEEEFTCSPLFIKPKNFRKGFTSSASSLSLKDKDEENTKTSVPSATEISFNTGAQKQRNEDFLQVINSSSVKDLQLLQTVGAKRAKLIFDWRQTYGSFSDFKDLQKVPGFTEKYVQKLLHSNLIMVS